MNGQELVDLTIAKIVPITDGQQVANVNSAFALAAVNEAYHIVERAALWKWSEAEATLTTVVGQHAYVELTDIATDLATIQHVYDEAAQTELAFIDERQRYHYTPPASRGIPECWSRWAGELRLHPIPSGVRNLTVRYYAAWADLALGTEPVFPATYHDMLADYAASVLALRMPPTGERFLPGSRAQPHQAAFGVKLEQMLRDPRSQVTMDDVPQHDWQDFVNRAEHW